MLNIQTNKKFTNQTFRYSLLVLVVDAFRIWSQPTSLFCHRSAQGSSINSNRSVLYSELFLLSAKELLRGEAFEFLPQDQVAIK
jgi:hypothetical protein